MKTFFNHCSIFECRLWLFNWTYLLIYRSEYSFVIQSFSNGDGFSGLKQCEQKIDEKEIKSMKNDEFVKQNKK